jgi:hypothetical protein
MRRRAEAEEKRLAEGRKKKGLSGISCAAERVN